VHTVQTTAGRVRTNSVARRTRQRRADLVPQSHWSVYHRVIATASERQIPFALGGALAVANYTGSWRFTKDLDLYVMPADRERMIEVLAEAGLRDYYEKLPYDRGWIYRGNVDDIIVDVIWGMPNRRTEVDAAWLSRGPCLSLNGDRIRVLPLEELIWAKIYVLQKDRSDWPDIFNLIFAAGSRLDWERLLDRLGEDAPLLSAVLSIFRWLNPAAASRLPDWLWQRLALPQPQEHGPRERVRRRAKLLDTRPWFAPVVS
jgi:hypothetical protein